MSENYAVRFIEHYGISGQKHGRRRFQYRDGSLTPAGRIRYGKGKPRKPASERGIFGTKKRNSAVSEDEQLESQKKPASRPKRLSEMSDEELQKQIDRLSLEKKYNDLMKDVYPMSPKKEHKVRDAFSEIALTSLKNIGTQTMTYAMGSAVNKVCRGVFNINYDVVNAKKGQDDKKK